MTLGAVVERTALAKEGVNMAGCVGGVVLPVMQQHGSRVDSQGLPRWPEVYPCHEHITHGMVPPR